LIVALIDIDTFCNSGSYALASQIETAWPSTHVQVIELDERLWRTVPPSSGAWMDHALGRILEGTPRLVVIYCTLWNIGAVLELIQRLHQLSPELAILLSGPEATARRQELQHREEVSQVLTGPPASSVLAVMKQLHGSRSRGGSRPSRVSPGGEDRVASPFGRREEELIEQGLAGRPLLVELEWGGRFPSWLYRHLDPAPPCLNAIQAAARVIPLLRRGLEVTLSAPMLASQKVELVSLLRQLRRLDRGRLTLELQLELLDEPLADLLCAAPLGLLELEVGRAPSSSREVARQATLIRRLCEASIDCRAVIVFGFPEHGHRGLLEQVDRAVQSGLEDLVLQRLLVPPGSRYHQRNLIEALHYAPVAPYEVLGHGPGGFAELQSSRRLASTYHLLKDELAGTGLLRGLATVLGSPAALVEGFGEQLTLQGKDVFNLTAGRGGHGRLFLDYLRRQHGLDLRFGGEEVQLVRSPMVALRWLPDGRRFISDDSTGRTAHLGRHALTLLDRFDQAQPGREVCEQLLAEAPEKKRSSLRRALYQALDKLVSMSFLVPRPDRVAVTEGEEHPFTCLEEFEYHYRMLADATRVAAYQQAIARAVVPDQHVIEIGTGTGILAILAAKAGARVTAIERFSIVGMAQAIGQQSGVGDRIRFIRGRSDLVDVPERGDLLISEIVGNRILNEGVLETTLDARKRLLKPQARLIPCALEILAEVGHSQRYEPLLAELDRVGQSCQISLAPLKHWFAGQLSSGQVIWELGAVGAEDGDFRSLTDEVSVIRLELAEIQSADFSRTIEIQARRTGVANAVLLAFRLVLQPGIEISTAGRSHNMHWSKPVYMLARALPVNLGETLKLRVQHESHGELEIQVEC
jgi:hypothetical protein